MRVTPEKITRLKPNEIFVFGSNLLGLHAGGAAFCAQMLFGAKNGQGVGPQGQSYAIPTLNEPGGFADHMLPISEIREYVDDFLVYAKNNPDKFFYVTPIGCGIAGFTPQQIAPLFHDALEMENISLPASFIEVLGSKAAITEAQIRKIVREEIENFMKSRV